MLGYKAWNVAHNGGERVDPRNDSASAEAIAEQANWKEGQCSPAQAAVEEKGQPHTQGEARQLPLMMRHAEGQCSPGEVAVEEAPDGCAGISAHAFLAEGDELDKLEMVFDEFGCGLGTGAWR